MKLFDEGFVRKQITFYSMEQNPYFFFYWCSSKNQTLKKAPRKIGGAGYKFCFFALKLCAKSGASQQGGLHYKNILYQR